MTKEETISTLRYLSVSMRNLEEEIASSFRINAFTEDEIREIKVRIRSLENSIDEIKKASKKKELV